MNAAESLKKEIDGYLDQLNERQKKAVLTVIKTFAEDQHAWEDELFISELDQRTQEFENGKAKLLTLEELEKKARSSFKAKSKKKK